jgi:DNA-binding MarR family transcriptional regulator
MDKILLEFIETLDQSLKRLQPAGFEHLTVSQFQYIDAIAALGQPTITEIAARLGFSKPSVTAGIQKLVELGFVVKTQSKTDKRVFYVVLSEAGAALVAAKAQTLQEYGKFVRSALSVDETRQFEALLTKLVAHFKG